jgi:xanthine dehydrogenase YagR molybdenum-binding subunit
LQVLQTDRIYYGGQPIALAVAETLEAAQEAASHVIVRYEEQKPTVTLAGRKGESYVPEKAGGAGDPGTSNRGDTQQGLASASQKLDEVYGTAFHTHSPMEPHSTIAVWDGPDKLTLYDTSQGIFGDRKRVAELLGLQPENVRVISLYLGGGFGSKGPTWSHTVICALAARQVNRPVKLVLRRPQMFGPVGNRSQTLQSISAGATQDGKLTALSNETLSHTSTMDEFTETATLPTRMLYSVPNNFTVQRLVRPISEPRPIPARPGRRPERSRLKLPWMRWPTSSGWILLSSG